MPKAWYRRLRPTDLHTCPAPEAARTAVKVIDAIQGDSPRAQLLGMAIAFASLLRRSEMNPAEVYQVGVRVLNSEEMRRPEVGFIRDYLDEEVMGEL